jgi:hypothetical protein
MTRALENALHAGLPPRNRIYNPAFQISQEFGADAATGVTSAAVKYICDGWQIANTTTGTVIASQSTAQSPAGSKYRLGMAVTVADATVGINEYVIVQQAIEGYSAFDLKWGTAAAKPVTMRFVFNVPIAGTYGFSICNATGLRCYVTPIVVAANEINTDKLVTLTIPGDTGGTWAVDNNVGIIVRWCYMAGTTYQTGTPNTWGSANMFTTAAQVNNVATTSGGGSIADVGLYEGTSAPPFEVPHLMEELRRCQRYLEYVEITLTTVAYATQVALMAQKRLASPTITLVSGATNGGAATAYGPSVGGVVGPSAGSTVLRASTASTGAVDALYKIDARM